MLPFTSPKGDMCRPAMSKGDCLSPCTSPCKGYQGRHVKPFTGDKGRHVSPFTSPCKGEGRLSVALGDEGPHVKGPARPSRRPARVKGMPFTSPCNLNLNYIVYTKRMPKGWSLWVQVDRKMTLMMRF